MKVGAWGGANGQEKSIGEVKNVGCVRNIGRNWGVKKL